MTSNNPKKKLGYVLPNHCDICWQKDGSRGMVLHRCNDCGIRFHSECYGLVGTNNNFQCYACQAVGRTFHVRDTHGKRVAVTVKERPTECCLCGTDNKLNYLHAMHPIFDDHGPTGRQILLFDTMKLAWAHTLCCVTIATRTGVVNGCHRDGSISDGNADMSQQKSAVGDDDDDDESVNSVLVNPSAESANRADVTHYVYTLPKNPRRDRENRVWLDFIKDTQRHTKCTFCGQDDNVPGVYRLALQCCANDEAEYEGFRDMHPNLQNEFDQKTECTKFMHVGCAAFRPLKDGSWPSRRRTFFFPGRLDETAYQELVVNNFCDEHAQDIKTHALKPPQPLFHKLALPSTENESSSKPISPASKRRLSSSSKVVTDKAAPSMETGRVRNLSDLPQASSSSGGRGNPSLDKTSAREGLKNVHASSTPAPTAQKRKASSDSHARRLSNSSLDVIPRKKREKREKVFKISPNKLQRMDAVELEGAYKEIMVDMVRRRMEVPWSDDDNESPLLRAQVEWKERLSLSLTDFSSLWTRVERAVKEEMALLEQSRLKVYDWSVLEVGPTFDPDYDFSKNDVIHEDL